MITKFPKVITKFTDKTVNSNTLEKVYLSMCGNSIIGFTLAELLIALAILGVITTFTIPKIISAKQNEQYNSAAKEAIATISSAYQLYKLNNTVSSSTTPGAFTQYINYISIDTTSSLDAMYNTAGSVADCTFRICFKLPSGGTLTPYTPSFGGTNTTNSIFYKLDPDGKVTDGGSATGPGKSIEIHLFYDGKIATRGSMGVTAVSSDQSRPPSPGADPPWFHWD